MTTATASAVTFHRSTLAGALGSLAKLATGKRLPVLSHLRLTAEDGAATLEATDLETRARIRIACEGEGEAILPATLLSELVARLSSQSVTLEIEGTRVTVKGGRSVAKLTALPAQEWPEPSEEDAGDPIALPMDTLRFLAFVGAFASDDDTRPILNGIYIHDRDGRLSAAGVHGHYMALRESGTPSAGLDLILPPAGLTFALRLMEGAPEVQVRRAGYDLELSTDTASVRLRTIEGPFPNYDQIIPRDQDKHAVFDRKEMIDALKRMEIIARQGANEKNLPRVACEFGEEGLRLSVARDNEIEETVTLQSYTGNPIRIGFNVTYLLLILGQINQPTVELQMKAEERSAVIQTESEGLFLLMPLRLI